MDPRWRLPAMTENKSHTYSLWSSTCQRSAPSFCAEPIFSGAGHCEMNTELPLPKTYCKFFLAGSLLAATLHGSEAAAQDLSSIGTRLAANHQATQFAISAKDTAPSQTISLADRIVMASRLYADIQSYFGHWKAIPGYEIDQEYSRYINEVIASEDRRAFDLSSMKF